MSCPISSDAVPSFEFIFTVIVAVIVIGLFLQWKVRKAILGPVAYRYCINGWLLLFFRWYVGDMSRQRAESLLKQEDKEGCFVVRNSSTKGLYTLSLYTKVWVVHSLLVPQSDH